jgi:2-keto-4-pentenoate hydratase/2-oxohepta-3-ene-1,7-dioic acid hydratase in catechol pathway
MQLVTLNVSGGAQPGVVIGNQILALPAAASVLPAARCIPPSVRAILEAGDAALDLIRRISDQAAAARDALREQGALMARRDASLLAPIPDPGLVVSAGMNYGGHLKEMNTPIPERPTHFLKSPRAVVGPGAPIVLPPSNPDMVDWEGEFCVVIGRPCHNVSAKEALDHVAGYTIANDVSARDWVAPVFAATGIMGPIHAWERNILGKQFPSFCPLGPTLVTRDEIADPGALKLTTRLNGKIMQRANTNDLVFGVRELIAYFSQFYLLRPGDVITTGSPAGVGYGRNPKVFMRPGDTIEVRIDGIGTLANPVVAAGRAADRRSPIC